MRVREPGLSAIYARVSTDQQADGADKTSLDRQEKNARRTAGKLDLPINESYVEKEAHSASDPANRPGLERLLRGAARGDFRYVIMDVVDRTTRAGDEDFYDILHRFERYGVECIWASHPEWDMQNIADRHAAADAARDAYRDKLTIARRFQDGKQERIENGQLIRAFLLYGYRWDMPGPRWRGEYDDDPRQMWEPDEGDGSTYQTAAVVRRIYGALAAGGSAVKLMDALNAEGIPTPSQVKNQRRKSARWGGKPARWTIGIITYLVKNPSYKGQRPQHRYLEVPRDPALRRAKNLKTHRTIAQRPESEWVWVEVPPLVSAEVWHAANDQLAHNQRHSHRSPTRYTSADVLLSGGYVRCAYCKKAMQPYQRSAASTRGKRGQTLNWNYHCARASRHVTGPYADAHGRCQGVNKLARVVDTFVWEQAVAILSDPDYLRSLLHTTDEANAAWSPEAQIAHYSTLLAQCDADEHGLADEMLHWRGDPVFAGMRERAKEELKRIVAQRTSYAEKLAAAQQEQERQASQEARLEAVLARNASVGALDSFTPDERRTILADLHPIVEVARPHDPLHAELRVTFYLTPEAAAHRDADLANASIAGRSYATAEGDSRAWSVREYLTGRDPRSRWDTAADAYPGSPVNFAALVTDVALVRSLFEEGETPDALLAAGFTPDTVQAALAAAAPADGSSKLPYNSLHSLEK